MLKSRSTESQSVENAEKCIFGDELIIILRTTPTQPTAELCKGSDPEHFSANDAPNQQFAKLPHIVEFATITRLWVYTVSFS